MSYANRPLNRQDYKTLTLAALGGALEFYDFIIFVFFAAVVGELFFPADIPEWLRQVQTFGIFAAGYLARPLGGIIMAHFGDLVGRGGGDPDVTGLATKALRFCPGHHPAGQQYCHHYALHRLSAGRAGGGSFWRQPHVHRRQFATGALQLGVLSPFRQQSTAAVPAVWHGGIMRRGCGRRTLRHGARFPGGGSLYRHFLFI